MIRYLLAVLPVLGLALLAAACDGGGSSSATPTATAGATPTAPASGASGEQPSPTAASDLTPTVEDSPTAGDTPATGEDTPAAINQTPVSERTPPAPTGTPAVVVTPVVRPTSVMVDLSTDQAECVFDVETSTADCAGWGMYTIDPPLSAGYTTCSLNIIEDQPTMLICSGSEYVPTVYYAIP